VLQSGTKVGSSLNHHSKELRRDVIGPKGYDPDLAPTISTF
jgi:hypothetical protein